MDEIKDLLGNVLKSNTSLADTMKDLIRSIGGNVKKTKSTTGVDCCEEYIDEIKKLPEQIVKEFKKEYKELNNLSESIEKFGNEIKRIRGGGSGRGRSGTGNRDDDSQNKKPKSELSIEDELRLNARALTNEIQKSEMGAEALSEYLKDLEISLSRTRKGANFWSSSMSNIAFYGGEVALELERSSKNVDLLSDDYEKMLGQYDQMSNIIDEATRSWQKLGVQDKRRLRDLIQQAKAIEDSNESTEEKAKKVAEVYTKIYNTSRGIVAYQETLGSMLENAKSSLSGFGSSFSNIFQGLFGPEVIGGFFEGLREGVEETVREAGLLRSLVRDQSWAGPGEYFNELLTVSKGVVDQVGLPPNIIRKSWISAIRKGTRNLEDTKNVLNDALALSTAIGSNSENTASEFQVWNMELGFTSKQTSVLARNIKLVAKSTGVVGDELTEAVSKARKFAQEMRNAGLNADKAAASLIGISASAQKFGVEDQIGEVLSALTGGLDSFADASPQIKNLIAQAGLLNEAVTGSALNDPSAQRKTLMGISNALVNEFRRYGAVTADGLIDTSKLSTQQISELNFVLRQMFGKNFGVGQAQRVVEAIGEQTKSRPQKITEINKKIETNNNLTESEKKSIEEQIKSLKILEKSERNTLLVDTLDKIFKATENTSSPEESIKSLEKVLEEQSKTAESRGIDFSKDFNTTLKNSIESVNEKLKEAGKSQIDTNSLLSQANQAMSTNNFAELRDVLEKVSLANQEADTALKTNSNAIDKVAQLQNQGQAILQGVLSGIVEFIGFLPPIISLLSSIVFATAGLKEIKAAISFYGKDAMQKAKEFQVAYSSDNTLYTHDTRNAKLLKKILKELGGGRTGVKNNNASKSGKSSAFKEASPLDAVGDAKIETPKNMKQIAKNMLKGALYLSLLAVGIIALATVILSIGKGIMDIMGIDLNSAIKIGTTIAAVLISAGVISGAVIASAKGVELLAEIDKFIDFKKVRKGALTLLKIVPSILLLATSIIFISSIFNSLGFNSEKSVSTAENISLILLSASVISAAVLAATAGIYLLGTFSDKILSSIPILYKGAITLIALTVPMVLLASAIIGLTKLFSFGLSSGESLESAKNLSSFMWAAVEIASSVILMSLLAGVLAAMLPVALFMIPIAFIAAISFSLLGGAVVRLSESIINFATEVSVGKDMKSVSESTKNLDTFFDSALSVVWSIIKMSALIPILAAMILPALLMVFLAPVASMTIGLLGSALSDFSKSVIQVGTELQSQSDPKEMEKASKSIEEISKIAKSLGDAVDVLSKSIVPLFTKPILGIFGESVAEKVSSALDKFAEEGGLLDVLKNFFEEVSNKIKDSKNVDPTVGQKLVVITDIVSKLKPVLDFMTDTVVKFADDGGWIGDIFGETSIIEDIAKATPKFKEMLDGAINFLNEISKDVNLKTVDEESLTQASKKLESVANIIKNLKPITDFLTKNVIEFAESRGFLGLGSTINEKIMESTTPFRKMISVTIDFLNAMVADINNKSFDEEGYKKAGDTLSRMANIISYLNTILDFMTEKVVKFTEGSWIDVATGNTIAQKISAATEPFRVMVVNIANFMKDGIVKAIIDADVSENTYTRASDTLSRMANIIQSLNPIIEFMTTTVKDLTTGDWQNTGVSAAQFLKEEGVPAMYDFVKYSAEFIRDGIVKAINEIGLNDKEFEAAAMKLARMSEVIQYLRPIIDFMMTTVSDLVAIDPEAGQVKAEYLQQSLPAVKSFIYQSGLFIKEGIIEPLKNLNITEADVSLAIENLQGLSNVINSLTPVLDFIGSSVQNLSNNSDSINGMYSFGSFYSSMTYALKLGLIDPVINSMWILDEINLVNEILFELLTSLDTLSQVAEAFSQINIPIDTINSGLSGIGSIGSVNTSKNIGSMTGSFAYSAFGGNSEEDSKEHGFLLTQILGALTGVGSPQTSTSGGFGKLFSGSLMSSVGKPLDKVNSGLEKTSENDLNISEVFKSSLSQFGSIISGVITSSSNAIISAINSMSTVVNVTIDGKTSTVTTKNGSENDVPVGKASTGSIDSMDDKIAERVQSSKPSASIQLANEELIKIAINTEKLVQINQASLEKLEELVEMLNIDASQTTSSNEAASNTSLNFKSGSTPNYYTWRQGRYGDTPNKQYVNAGI